MSDSALAIVIAAATLGGAAIGACASALSTLAVENRRAARDAEREVLRRKHELRLAARLVVDEISRNFGTAMVAAGFDIDDESSTDDDTAATAPEATDDDTAATAPEATDDDTAATAPEATDDDTAATAPEATDDDTAATAPEATDDDTAAIERDATGGALHVEAWQLYRSTLAQIDDIAAWMAVALRAAVVRVEQYGGVDRAGGYLFVLVERLEAAVEALAPYATIDTIDTNVALSQRPQ